jgi:nucleoside-diphosphate-sugar epimerase
MVTNPSLGIKHAFVTGATGIVGTPLCRELASAGVRVTAYSRSEPAASIATSIEHRRGDIFDFDVLERSVGDADVFFHVAAAVHGSAKNYAEFERINVQGTANVIRAAKKNHAKLIYVSTVNVEGFRSGSLADSYAETKSMAEELVLKAGDKGLNVVVVRPATVFGEVPGIAGVIVDRLLSGSMRVLPAPSRMISPVWSRDLAAALIGAARQGESGRTYTVAGPTLSTGDFVEAVCEAGKLKQPLLSVPAWMIAVPLQLAWWVKDLTRLKPPVSVESLLHGSSHDGASASIDLGFEYSDYQQIFG